MSTRILLADDSVTIRKVVELTFSDSDIHVESVASGREALECFEDLKPDLVLADVVMPEISGYEVCQQVKSSTRPVPVLLLAGTFEPFDPARAEACGADGHLIKPFESHSLVERVEQLLEIAREVARQDTEPDVDVEAEELLAEVEQAAEEVLAADPEPDEDNDTSATITLPLSEVDLDRLARRVTQYLAADTLRDIAWDVVPEIAERMIRERLQQLENDADTPGDIES
jgi:CheY-like chemotaxis protein